MKRTLRVVAIALVVLIIVLLVVVFASLNSLVKAAVEKMGPKVTGTSVTLDNVKISPLSGAGALGGLHIGNPEGFRADSAFELGEVSVNIGLKSLRSDTIVIEEILIDGPKVTFEGDLRGSNIGKIRKNVEAFTSLRKAPEVAEPSPEKPKKPGKKVQINRFVFKNGQVRLAATLLEGQAATVPLPDIELTDIGKASGGTTVAEAVKQIFPAIYKAIIESVADADEVLKKGAEALEKQANGLRDSAEEGASKVIEGVKGILDR